MLVRLENAGRSFGAEQIFSGVSCAVQDRDRIGLVGMNGAGKTTLLNVVCGALEADSGEVIRGSGFAYGYLRQNCGLVRDNTVEEEMRSVFSETEHALRELSAVSDEMAASAGDALRQQALSERYKRLEDFVLARDGYQIDVKINTVLNGMGFAEGRERRINTLSGGEQTRLALAKLLLEEPALLMLDEPTNHLDFTTLTWLEDYLSRWKGALLLVSHDRYFLDRLCTSIWELEDGELTLYRGNYTDYRKKREAADVSARKQYEEQKQEIARMEEYVAKNLVRASTTKMAQSRRKAAEKAKEELAAPRRRLRPPRIRLEYEGEPVSDVLKVSGLEVEVGDEEQKRQLMSGVEFTIKRGDRVAVIGPNGAGKTTLIRCLLGEQSARGDIEWGRGVRRSYFDQGSDNLDGGLTVLETLRESYPSASETSLRSALGAMGLVGDDAFKYVSQLSGGERARLKLAVICLAGSNTLVLDEPTNHLDLATKEVLEDTLCGYTGTVIMVSHDRYLLDRVPTRIFAIEDGGLTQIAGGYSQYIAAQEARQSAAPSHRQQKPPTESAAQHYRSKQDRREEAMRRTELVRTEALIARLEDKDTELREAMAASAEDYEQLQQLCQAAQENTEALSAAMERWVELSGE